MITVIRDERAVDLTAHEITDREAARISRTLARDGIRIEPVSDPFGVLHLWALEPCTTVQEVCALRAFLELHDGRVAFHQAVAR